MENPNKSVIHNIDSTETTGVGLPKLLMILGIVLVVGILVGFGGSKLTKSNKTGTSATAATEATTKTAGIVDKKTFKDSAEGVLKEGGIDGEGNFHLERPGGPSQNAYLTSTTVDLSQYVNKKVRVWGATFQGEKAGWLMDVGTVEVLQ